MAQSSYSWWEHKIAKIVFIVTFAIVLLITFLSINKSPDQSQAQSGNQCPTSYMIGINGGTTTGVTSGLAIVGLSAAPPSGDTTLKVERVMFKIDSAILGRATLNGTSQYYWSMDWLSQVTADGPHNITAEVLHTNGFYCSVQNGKFTDVQNPTKFTFPAQSINPTSWVGPTNLPVDFEIAQFGSPDVRRFMQVDWSTNIGSFPDRPNSYIGRFSSGTSAGEGRVKARIYYGGEVKDIEVPVSIMAYNTDTTQPTTNTTNTTTTNTSDSDISDKESDDTTTGSSDDSESSLDDGSTTDTSQSSTTNTTLTSKLLNSDGTIKQCLLNSIGEDRLKSIEEEESRPTAAEFDKYRSCFARQSFVVAQSLSPVSPDAVRGLPKTKKIAFKRAETVTKKVEGVEVDRIVFSGTANPNATVLIYIFSEPLVLTTAANDAGEWTYTLEDPLESGNHEAYSLVDTGNGDYERSDVLSFVIEKAEASEANPEGYSLQLVATATATVDNRSQNIFIAGAVSLVALTVIALAIILNVRNKHKLSLQTITDSTAEQDNSNNITPVNPVSEIQSPQNIITETPLEENQDIINEEPVEDIIQSQIVGPDEPSLDQSVERSTNTETTESLESIETQPAEGSTEDQPQKYE